MKHFEMKQGYTLMISPELMNEIAYLHSKNDNKEWCGMLFYEEVSGSLFNSDLVLRAKHIYLLDIGTSAYTAGSVDLEMLDFFEEVPEAEDMKRGFIHTHHGMKAYFSGTDMSELYDNTKYYDYYLSLIVNHATVFCTKIGMEAEIGVTGTTLQVDNPPILTFDGTVEFDIPTMLAARQVRLSKVVVSGYGSTNQLYRDTPFEEHISPNQMNIFDVPGVDSAGFDSNGTNHYQEKLNGYYDGEFELNEDKMFSTNAFSAMRKLTGLAIDKQFTSENIIEALKPMENLNQEYKDIILDTQVEEHIQRVIKEEYGPDDDGRHADAADEMYNLAGEFLPGEDGLKDYPFVSQLVHTIFEELAVITINYTATEG